jgi:sulfur relay (sulfurtransferase) complex TusBCD TusD component (DsrE family)
VFCRALRVFPTEGQLKRGPAKEISMASYLLFESQEPFESAEVPRHYELAAGLAQEGNQVTVFLIQNGVSVARRSVGSDAFGRLVRSGVAVLADEFSLRERGIAPSRLAPGVKIATLDDAVDQFAEGRKALWF